MDNFPVDVICSVFIRVRFCLVRVFVKIGKTLRSVCSVDFVEKMCKSLCRNLWENLRKSFHKWQKMVVLHINTPNNTHFDGFCGKISRWFCTRFYICKSGGFAHFPQSLLLQLLNIL